MTQALTAYGDGRVELIDMVAPTKTIDEILIRPLFSGVCGKDLEIIRGDIDPSSISNPIVLGHEWCGEVIATSPARPDIHKWDQVLVQGIIPCESCVECSSGNTNRCLTYDEFGFTRNGAIAPYLVAPAKLVHKINSTITPSVAALVEPMAVVLTGFMKADIGLSPSILIIGDGTIGLLLAVIAANWEPASITMIGLRPEQIELAKESGVTEFLLSDQVIVNKFDLVIEASGFGVAKGIASLKRGGKILLLGFAGTGKSTPLVIDEVVNADISILGSFGYTSQAWASSVAMVNSGVNSLSHLITHTFPLSKWANAIETLKSSTEPRGKVVIAVNPISKDN